MHSQCGQWKDNWKRFCLGLSDLGSSSLFAYLHLRSTSPTYLLYLVVSESVCDPPRRQTVRDPATSLIVSGTRLAHTVQSFSQSAPALFRLSGHWPARRTEQHQSGTTRPAAALVDGPSNRPTTTITTTIYGSHIRVNKTFSSRPRPRLYWMIHWAVQHTVMRVRRQDQNQDQDFDFCPRGASRPWLFPRWQQSITAVRYGFSPCRLQQE